MSGAFQAGKWEGSRTAAAPSSAASIFSRDYRSYMMGGTYQVLPALKMLLSIKRYDDKTIRNFDATQLPSPACIPCPNEPTFMPPTAA